MIGAPNCRWASECGRKGSTLWRDLEEATDQNRFRFDLDLVDMALESAHRLHDHLVARSLNRVGH